jgi:hypothetical protein
VSPRQGAFALAAGRAALGATILAAPEAVTSRWLGARAEHPIARYLARSLGARDLALGLLALQTLGDTRLGPRVQVAAAFADSVDAFATVAARSELPVAGAIGTVVVAGASAVAGFYFSHQLAQA